MPLGPSKHSRAAIVEAISLRSSSSAPEAAGLATNKTKHIAGVKGWKFLLGILLVLQHFRTPLCPENVVSHVLGIPLCHLLDVLASLHLLLYGGGSHVILALHAAPLLIAKPWHLGVRVADPRGHTPTLL